MIAWCRSLYELALIACLMRSWPLRHDLSFWRWSLAASAILNAVWHPESSAWCAGIWPWLLPIPPLLRAIAAAEAFSRLIGAEFWDQARRLSSGMRMVAFCQTCIVAAVAEGTTGGIGWLIRMTGYLRIWTADWFLLALLYLYCWPGMRRGHIRHALILCAMLCIEASGTLIRISGVRWAAWHKADMALYLMATMCLAIWCAFVPPARPRTPRPCV